MPRPIDAEERQKWRGYLSSLEPLPREIVTAVIRGCKGTCVDLDHPEQRAIILDVLESGVLLDLPSKPYLISFDEIFSAEEVLLYWLRRGQTPTQGDLRNPDPETDLPDISHSSYAPRLAERIKRELLDLVAPIAAEPSDCDTGHETIVDQRRRVMRSILDRKGQPKFRNALRERYGDRCLITGCQVLDILEAAHIKPYCKGGEDDPENGLLLRADIHTLFDLDLLGIEPNQLRIELHPAVASDSEYKSIVGKALQFPSGCQPSQEALGLRFYAFQERLKAER